MDQAILVKDGQRLLDLMDSTAIKPRAAVWVYSTDTDTWRFWVVPNQPIKDERELYREISELISKHKIEVPNIDASDVKWVNDSHPAIRGLAGITRVTGISSVRVSNNFFSGYYLPDGIILRMDI